MLYVIVLNKESKDDRRGRYVAPPGQEKSYTDRLDRALVVRDPNYSCCGNESVVPLESVLEGLER